MAKHKAAAAAGPDPDGEAWHTEARAQWEAAEAEAARVAEEFPAEVAGASSGNRKKAARARSAALDIYGSGPALPDFRAKAAKELELGDDEPILGRFLYQPGRNLVHDVTRAGPDCAIRETPRLFVHFASELEAAVPAGAEAHSCMAG